MVISAMPNGVAGWRVALPFVVVAALGVIGGGLLSAVLAHAPTRSVMWLVAYLVLVVGVMQLALGLGQAWLAQHALSSRWLLAEGVLFNAGNGLVMAGTLSGHAAWVGVGAILLVAALLLFALGVRGVPRSPGLHVYRVLLLLLGVSAMTGWSLAVFRAAV